MKNRQNRTKKIANLVARKTAEYCAKHLINGTEYPKTDEQWEKVWDKEFDFMLDCLYDLNFDPTDEFDKYFIDLKWHYFDINMAKKEIIEIKAKIDKLLKG